MDPMEGMGFSCAGVPLPAGGGTWKGHVIPGIVFLAWGVYWLVQTFQRHFRAQSLGRMPAAAQPWYPCLLLGRWLYAAEPFLKMLGGPIGVSIELYFDSKSGFRPLYCSDSGRFAPEYAHNYQHAASYPGFLLSGFVDFLGMFVQLPEGTEQVFLALAFGTEGFLMTLHKKHLPLDKAAHELLGYTMLAGSLGVILELRRPTNFFLSVFRSFAVMMQGVWLIAMGQMMFTMNPAWSDDYKGPAMMIPPAFAMLALVTALGTLLLFLAMQWWHRRAQAYASLPTTMSKQAEGGDLSPRDGGQFGDFTLDDSANETSDDGSDSNEQDHLKPARSSSNRSQIASAALNILKSARQKTPGKSSEHII